MQNVPILEIAASALSLLTYVKLAPVLRAFGTKLPQARSAGNDDSIWITRAGAVYEDIGTFFIRAESVTFRHKNGTTRLEISELTDETRVQMIRRYHGNHSLAILSRDNDLREVRVSEIEAA